MRGEVCLPSCRRRRRPQPGDQRKHFGEHLPRHRDFGPLEGDVPAVADDPGADLDQLLAQLVSDHGSAVLGITSVRMKLAEVVGQNVELEADCICREATVRAASI